MCWNKTWVGWVGNTIKQCGLRAAGAHLGFRPTRFRNQSHSWTSLQWGTTKTCIRHVCRAQTSSVKPHSCTAALCAARSVCVRLGWTLAGPPDRNTNSAHATQVQAWAAALSAVGSPVYTISATQLSRSSSDFWKQSTSIMETNSSFDTCAQEAAPAQSDPVN